MSGIHAGKGSHEDGEAGTPGEISPWDFSADIESEKSGGAYVWQFLFPQAF